MADLDMWVNNNKEAIDNSSKIIAKEIKDGVAEIARQIQEGAAHVGAEIEDGLRHVGAEIKEAIIHGALYIGFIMIIVAIILTYVVYPQERDPPKTKNLKAHGRKNLSYIRLESVISDHHSKLWKLTTTIC